LGKQQKTQNQKRIGQIWELKRELYGVYLFSSSLEKKGKRRKKIPGADAYGR